MNNYKFGNYICKLREAHNLTQIELAKILDVSDKAVSKWENGQAIPRMDTLEKLAVTLNTTVEDILSASKDNIIRICIKNDFDITCQLEKFKKDIDNLDNYNKVIVNNNLVSVTEEEINSLIENRLKVGLWDVRYNWGNKDPEQEVSELKEISKVAVDNLLILKNFTVWVYKELSKFPVTIEGT